MLTYLMLLLAICTIISLFSQHAYVYTQVGGADAGADALSGWARDGSCNYEMIKVLKTFIKSNHLNQNTGDNWSVYLPCGYNNSELELQKIRGTHPEQKVFIIKGCDNISRKDTLWARLYATYGEQATRFMPRSYVLTDKRDVARLNADYDANKVYILKKNIQRQEGLKITKDRDTLLAGLQSGFVVAQEMLQDPYIIDGRKTNCRCYLLVVCKDGKKSGYLYTNGFMYYTPKPFQVNSTEVDRVITAGLATPRRDSTFYETHPLTLQQFQKYLTERGYKGSIFRSVGRLLNRVLTATSTGICTPSHLDKQTTFQLFGCDVAFNNKLVPQLMEINKGPDLTSKTDEEVRVKNVMIDLIFQLVGAIPKKPNNTPEFLMQIYTKN